jgi:hypothetical protein
MDIVQQCQRQARQFRYCARRDGDPGKIRTSDLRFRKPSLYPSELQGHEICACSMIIASQEQVASWSLVFQPADPALVDFCNGHEALNSAHHAAHDLAHFSDCSAQFVNIPCQQFDALRQRLMALSQFLQPFVDRHCSEFTTSPLAGLRPPQATPNRLPCIV